LKLRVRELDAGAGGGRWPSLFVWQMEHLALGGAGMLLWSLATW